MNKFELCEIAGDALENSYAPYSNCTIGAALLCKNGKVYTGCNVENASYSATVCAERTAFLKAISEGERDFEAIAIMGKTYGAWQTFYPCGICRQFMSEFCSPDFKIYVMIDLCDIREYTLDEFLPNSFDLKRNIIL